MRQLMLFLAALLFASASCTQVKVNNSVSVGVIDVEPSPDTVADSSVSDAPSEVVEVSDGAVEEDLEVAPDTLNSDGASDGPICVPACEEVECGDDGCGGVCGTCAGEAVCVAGACCAPQCENMACGDDSCGGLCGLCAETDTCEDGVCVSGQVCEPDCVEIYCGEDGCSGSCGECLLLDGQC